MAGQRIYIHQLLSLFIHGVVALNNLFLFSYTYELLVATEAPEEMFQFGGNDASQRNT